MNYQETPERARLKVVEGGWAGPGHEWAARCPYAVSDLHEAIRCNPSCSRVRLGPNACAVRGVRPSESTQRGTYLQEPQQITALVPTTMFCANGGSVAREHEPPLRASAGPGRHGRARPRSARG